MKASTVFDVICAAHYTYLVKSDFPARGGILLVAPPEQLKTTFIQIVENYSNALVLTDIVSRDISKIRNYLASNRYTTLALPELQKLYDRDQSVAANIEGNLRALMEEGFSYVPGGSPDMRVAKAKALILAGASNILYESNYDRWSKQGFLRRLLVCMYRMKDPFILSRAVQNWQRIEIENGFAWSLPVRVSIPYAVNRAEAAQITKWCRWQIGLVDPAAILHKIVSVLRWKNKRLKRKDDSFEILKDFSECLSKDGAEIEL